MFVEDLGHRVEDAEAKIDGEFVRSAEFEMLFERAYDRVQARENEDRIAYWAALEHKCGDQRAQVSACACHSVLHCRPL